MTRPGRRLLIVGAWGLSIAAVWFLTPRPPHDHEYTKWVLLGVFEFGFRWFLDLSIALLIALSLERRCGLTGRWILAVWTRVLVFRVWYDIIRAAGAFRHTPHLHELAYAWD